MDIMNKYLILFLTGVQKIQKPEHPKVSKSMGQPMKGARWLPFAPAPPQYQIHGYQYNVKI